MVKGTGFCTSTEDPKYFSIPNLPNKIASPSRVFLNEEYSVSKKKK
jgi:hypothetical protein